MKYVPTADGSVTLHNEQYGEHYHSLTGAKEEAIKKYVEPCTIPSRDSVVILDYCFGLGYNSAAALDAAKPGAHIKIIALEHDTDVLRAIGNIDYPFNCRSLILGAVTKGYAREGNKEVHVLVGDARDTITLVKDHIDVVFFDPFSPKKCPELWTLDVFKAVYALMNPGGILSTYSCAKVVRENMRAVGFDVRDGPVVKRWAPGTIAIKPYI